MPIVSRARTACGHVEACNLSRSCSRPDERREHMDRGCLAGTVRTEQTEELAGGDFEIEIVNSENVAVAFGEAGARIAAGGVGRYAR